MSPRSILRLLPTSMGGILNAICAIYFLQRGGNWMWLGIAHGVMVIVLGIIASQKAKMKDRELADPKQSGQQDVPSGPL